MTHQHNTTLSRLAAEATARAQACLRRGDPVPAAGIDLASNDYLGLSTHPAVITAAQQAVDIYGASARASRLVTGSTPIHHQLEHALAKFTGHESALVFSSGYTANLAAITTLSGPNTLIISDAHNHASLIDACRLAKGRKHIVSHNDVAAVRTALAQRAEPEALVVVESVYSVLGDRADISALAALCEQYDALLVVDEAHGLGVHGGGRGWVHEQLAESYRQRVIVTATLSKALAAQGGVVLGPQLVRQALVDTARTFIFDTGLAPAAVAAAHAALRLIADGQVDPARITQVGAGLAAGLGVPAPDSAVLQIPMPSPEAAVAARGELAQRGVLVGCFRPPSVPDGISRLRITCRGDLNRADCDTVLTELSRLVPTCIGEPR